MVGEIEKQAHRCEVEPEDDTKAVKAPYEEGTEVDVDGIVVVVYWIKVVAEQELTELVETIRLVDVRQSRQ